MEFKLNAEQRLIQDEARKFASTELVPIAEEFDKKGSFPYYIIKKLADLGFLGIIIPEKYGGSELDTLSYTILIEELSKVLASIGLILTVHNSFATYPILKYGTDSQKEKWLPKLSKGTIGAFAFTEENIEFSDVLFDKKTLKTSTKDSTILGEKTFVVNGESAELFIVFADTPDGLTAFLIEKNPNLTLVKEKVLGMRTSGICNLKLNAIKFTQDNILGGQGNPALAGQILSDTLNFGNIALSAISLGIGESALTEAIKYSGERQQFGHPISNFSLIRNTIVEMKMKLNATKLLLLNSTKNGNYIDSGLTRLHSGETASFITTKAIQIHGGYGYTSDYPVERFFRDAKVAQTFAGNPEFQRNSIASQILGKTEL